jgi:hypothetical protein
MTKKSYTKTVVSEIPRTIPVRNIRTVTYCDIPPGKTGFISTDEARIYAFALKLIGDQDSPTPPVQDRPTYSLNDLYAQDKAKGIRPTQRWIEAFIVAVGGNARASILLGKTTKYISRCRTGKSILKNTLVGDINDPEDFYPIMADDEITIFKQELYKPWEELTKNKIKQ